MELTREQVKAGEAPAVAEKTAIVFEGSPAYLFPDGTVRNEKGHWLVQTPQAVTFGIDVDPVAMAHRKHEVTRAKIAQGIAAAARERGVLPNDAPEALMLGAEALYSEVLAGKGRLRERSDTFKMLAQAANLLPSGSASVEMEDASGNRLRVPDLETLLELRREIQRGSE